MKKRWCTVGGMLVGSVVTYFFTAKDPVEQFVDNQCTNNDKYVENYNTLLRFVHWKKNGNSLDKRLVERGYTSVAIYGMGEIGGFLCDELMASKNVDVKYVIDNSEVFSEIEVKTMKDPLSPVDAIIVCVPYAYETIKSELQKKGMNNVLSINDILV